MHDIKYVVDHIVTIVNISVSRGLNHLQFIILLEDCGSGTSDILYQNAVLNTMGLWKREICIIYADKRERNQYPKLSELLWLSDPVFAVHLFENMKDLKKKLEGGFCKKGVFHSEGI
ncbi:hypothetical protein RF11_06973 [Thelohanellus kitauei]|uniref:Uncharacterized protein n=1 Tax=Thelohanellus kitauei TaxID=669202 RepID=A0A0C2I9L5_THEKT|nr:hypothetical protein RF11_06973 [Thelohanellus kitauei]